MLCLSRKIDYALVTLAFLAEREDGPVVSAREIAAINDLPMPLVAKILFLMFAFLWVRATFPRYRYDQIMRLGWKVFIPLTIVWIVVIGVMMMPPIATTWPFSIWFGR